MLNDHFKVQRIFILHYHFKFTFIWAYKISLELKA